MRLLLDGDLVAYRCAASIQATKTKEEEPNELAIQRADELVYRILETAQASEYVIYLSGEVNFRKLLDPTYKANRTQPRPRMLDPCREFLTKEWGALVCSEYEADDGIGIGYRDGDIIATIDKDLLQIPAEHYNFVKDTFQTVDEDEADFNFWMQMLVGDTSDNVRGVDGIGPVKARRALQGGS
jgi:5'-3' exonuclease